MGSVPPREPHRPRTPIYKEAPRLARLLAGVILLLAVTAAWAADQVIVEDWTKHPLGAKGIPAEWKGQSWGHPDYDFSVSQNDGHPVLHLRSRGDGSTIGRDVKGRIDLRQTPVLEWRWKVVTLPRNGNACAKATDDEAAQVYVAWPRFPEAVRTRSLGYVWDTTAPVGTVCRSEKTHTVTYIVVRSGAADLGKWITESRNVREDYRRVYGEEPDSPGVVLVGIDSNDTQSSAESFIGSILFRKP